MPLFTNCLEVVFPESGLPVYGVLGNLYVALAPTPKLGYVLLVVR